MHKSKCLPRIFAIVLAVCSLASVLITASAANPFNDISAADYFYDAVLWAVDKNITNGVGDGQFAPLKTCTRAEAVTFLWRAMGRPAPKATSCAFTDVVKDSYYYSALLWAVENKITTGTSATTFAPDMTLTREQFVTLLWRTAGSPVESAKTNFTDVPDDAYYATAVQWAVAKKITQGVGDNMFGPRRDCTRSQIATLLLRVSENTNIMPENPSYPQDPVYPDVPQTPTTPETPSEPTDPNKPAVNPSVGVGGKYETNWDV